MRVVTLGAFGDLYTIDERGYPVEAQRAGYRPRFLPGYDPRRTPYLPQRHGGLGDLPGNTVGDARTYLNSILMRAKVTPAIEDAVMTISETLGNDPARKLTMRERIQITMADDRSYVANGQWYRTAWFRYGLAAAAVMGGVYVVARSYR